MSSAQHEGADGTSLYRPQTAPSPSGGLDSPDDVAIHVEPPAGQSTASNDVWVWAAPSGFKYVEQRPDGKVTDVREPGDIHPQIGEYEFLVRLTTAPFCAQLSRVPRRQVPMQN